MKTNKKKKHLAVHPIITFILLIIVVMIASAILNALGVKANFNKINTATGEIETSIITVTSLLNADGIRYMITNAISNFINFAPLSAIIVSLIGIGIAEKSGFLKAIFGKTKKIPNVVLTGLVILLGVISSVFSDGGYVILIPLSALLFLINKRNPSIGIIAAFAGITGGYGANLILGSVDYEYSVITTTAAQLIDNDYLVRISSNYFVMIVAAIAITILGTWITEKFIAKKFPVPAEEPEEETTENRNRGLFFSIFAIGILLIIFIYTIIPGLPFSGLLLNRDEIMYLNQLFGYNSYLVQGFVFLFTFALTIISLAYGIGAGTIKNNKTFANFLTHALNDAGYMLVLLFMASQFVAIFKKSEIGTVIGSSLTNLIATMDITGLPLIIIFFLFATILGLFVTSSTIKWSMMSPIVVPMFMQNNLSPEFAQMIFRATDSITRGITPLMAFFVIYVVFLQKYTKNRTVSVGKSLSYMVPYTLGFTLIWFVIVIGWYILGAPIGVNVFPTM